MAKKSFGRWLTWSAVVAALTASIFFVAGYQLNGQSSSKKSGKAGGAKGGGAVPVAVAKAGQADVPVSINALGAVTPVYTVTVKTRVDGQLMDIHYHEGQVVKKGELLAQIDPRPFRATLTQAEGQLARDQAQLQNAFIDLDRYKAVYQQHAIPQQQLATQQAMVNQYQGTVKVDQGQIESASTQLDYTRITAPIAGRIGLRLVDPGNIVHASDTTGLLVITQLQPITVIFSVAEDYLSQILNQMRGGQKLEVDALDRDQQNAIARGSLLTVDNQIDATTGTVRLRAIFPNRDNHLFPNQFVNAKLLVRTLHNATVIPSTAVQRNSQNAYVYLVKPDQTVTTRKITIATTEDETTAVTGIDPGATVITDGFDKLEDGTKITVRRGPPADSSESGDGSSGSGSSSKE